MNLWKKVGLLTLKVKSNETRHNTALHLTESASGLPCSKVQCFFRSFEKKCRPFPQVNSTVM
jgi:hypothetical protein